MALDILDSDLFLRISVLSLKKKPAYCGRSNSLGEKNNLE